VAAALLAVFYDGATRSAEDVEVRVWQDDASSTSLFVYGVNGEALGSEVKKHDVHQRDVIAILGNSLVLIHQPLSTHTIIGILSAQKCSKQAIQLEQHPQGCSHLGRAVVFGEPPIFIIATCTPKTMLGYANVVKRHG
jgi:hypothetical protein